MVVRVGLASARPHEKRKNDPRARPMHEIGGQGPSFWPSFTLYAEKGRSTPPRGKQKWRNSAPFFHSPYVGGFILPRPLAPSSTQDLLSLDCPVVSRSRPMGKKLGLVCAIHTPSVQYIPPSLKASPYARIASCQHPFSLGNPVISIKKRADGVRGCRCVGRAGCVECE